MVAGLRPQIEPAVETRPEVHVGHEAEPGDEPEQEQQPPGGTVLPPLGKEPAQAERREDERDQGPDRERAQHVAERARPLPVEPDEVIADLSPDQAERPARIDAARWQRRIVERCARWILLAPDDRQQRVEGRGRRLVDRGMLRGAQIEVEVRRHRNQREHHAGQRKQPGSARRGIPRGGEEAQATEHDEGAAAESGADEQGPDARDHRHLRPLGSPHRGIRGGLQPQRREQEGQHGRSCQKREQVVPDRDARQVDDQEEQPRGPRLAVAAAAAPAHRQPRHRADREGRDRVDLGLVAVLPVGEREPAQHRPGRGGAKPKAGREVAEGLVGNEEEAAGRAGAEERAQEVRAGGEFAERHQHAPDVGDHDVERRSRRMGDAEHPCRGDELAGIPERDARREREHVAEQDDQRHARGGGVRRPVGVGEAGGAGHCRESTGLSRACRARPPGRSRRRAGPSAWPGPVRG